MLRNLALEWLRGVALGVVALVTGALACSVFVLGWLLVGLPVGWQPLGISALLLGGGWWIGHAVRARDPVPSLVTLDYVWQSVLAASWMIFAVFGAWVTLSSDANGVPDLGHYGIKAKAFYLAGGIPGVFPGGESWRLHAPSYPLGGAMMLEWLFAWMGEADIHLGRITQGMWLGAAGVLVAAWLRGRGLPKILAWGVGFLPLGTSGSLFYLTEFYQEALLNVALLSGLFLFVASLENDFDENSDAGSCRGHEAQNDARAGAETVDQPHRMELHCADGHAQVWSGALLSGACAWIKADGMLIWLTVTALWVVLARRDGRRGVLAASLTGAMLWIIPWRLWLAGTSVGLGDFSLSAFTVSIHWPECNRKCTGRFHGLPTLAGPNETAWWNLCLVVVGGSGRGQPAWSGMLAAARHSPDAAGGPGLHNRILRHLFVLDIAAGLAHEQLLPPAGHAAAVDASCGGGISYNKLSCCQPIPSGVSRIRYFLNDSSS